MFRTDPWAEAFINAAENPAAAENALEYLKVFCRAALNLPGDLSGKNDADRLGRSIKTALARTRHPMEGSSEPMVLAERFVQLLLRKKVFHHYKEIIRTIEKNIYNQKGIKEVFMEAATDPGEELMEKIKEKVKQLSGATDIIFSLRIIPGLIGGFRIRWGSILFDGSIKGRLQKMTSDLGAYSSVYNNLEA